MATHIPHSPQCDETDNAASAMVDGETLAISLGSTLRERRKARDLTLQELANLCGLSQPFLSQLENGKAMPSLLALHGVAAALGSSVQELLHPVSSTKASLVRGDSIKGYQLGNGASAHFLVEGADHQIGTNLIVAQPNTASAHDLTHSGEEVIYVLEGSVAVSLAGHDTVELQVGDAYTYSAATPHGWRNTGDRVARFLFISSPASF